MPQFIEEESQDEICLVAVESSEATLQVACSCTRGRSVAQIALHIQGENCCALLDTGAQICLLSEEIVSKLQAQGRISAYEPTAMAIQDLESKGTRVLGVVTLSVWVAGTQLDDIPFAVVATQDIPYCVVLGLNIIKLLNLKIDFSRNTCTVNTEVAGPNVGFITTAHI